MAYEPTIWQTGDVVSSEKLNKLENGVAGAGSGSGAKVLIFDPADNHGFVKSVGTYYSFDEIKNMLIEDPHQIVACIPITANSVCMPAEPLFVAAGTANPIAVGGDPNVDTIYICSFGYGLGVVDKLTLVVFEYTEEGISTSTSQTHLRSYDLASLVLNTQS